MYSISVVIPVYNEEKNIEKTLEAICNQTMVPMEIIVIDDCSRDDTYQIIGKIAQNHELIRVFRNEENIGAAETRNIGLDISNGDYIIFLDADDSFSPFFIEKMYSSIVENGADVVCCKSEIVSMKDSTRRIFGQWKRLSKLIMEGDELLIENPIDYPGIISLIDLAAWSKMIRRNHLVDNNIYFQNISSFNDLSFSLLTCLLAHKLVFINEALVEYHQFNIGSITSKREDNYCPIVKAYNTVLENKTVYNAINFEEFLNRAVHNILAIAFEDRRSSAGRLVILQELKDVFKKYDTSIKNIDAVCRYSLEYIFDNLFYGITKKDLLDYTISKITKGDAEKIAIAYSEIDVNLINEMREKIDSNYSKKINFKENEGDYNVRELWI